MLKTNKMKKQTIIKLEDVSMLKTRTRTTTFEVRQTKTGLSLGDVIMKELEKRKMKIAAFGVSFSTNQKMLFFYKNVESMPFAHKQYAMNVREKRIISKQLQESLPMGYYTTSEVKSSFCDYVLNIDPIEESAPAKRTYTKRTVKPVVKKKRKYTRRTNK